MRDRTSNKKKGRFIKRDDSLNDHLKVTDFNLMEICKSNVTFCDNPNSNIIHKHLHTKEELDIINETPDEISHVFNKKDNRPLIRPIDFTEEWEKIMEKQNSRNLVSLDDDEIDNEMAEFAKKLKEKNGEFPHTEEDLEAFLKAQEENSQDTEEFAPEETQSEALENQGLEQDIEDSSPEEETSISSTLDEIRASEENELEMAPTNSDETFDSINDEHEEKQELSQEHIDELVEEHSLKSQTTLAHEPSTDEFVQSNFAPVLDEQKLKAIEEKSHKKGYEDGYMLGEEKGLIDAQAKVEEIKNEFNNLIKELSGLKKSILLSSQENFRTIAQAMVESILEKEFKVDPNTFDSFIKKAISDTTTDDEFSVLVNKDTFNSLKNINSDIEKHLKIDDSLSDNNFKIESKLGTVDGQLKKIISELLDKVDLNIIDNKAG